MDMVERVARALSKADGDPAVLFDYYLEHARAAIEAMREPTDAMGAAGLMVSSHDPLGGREKMTDEQAESIGWTDRLRGNPVKWEMPIWRAMIDAALTRS